MQPRPVTAPCISYAFPDCIRTFASCFICSGVQLTCIFFFWLCFETPLHSCKCVYLPESEKKCHFEAPIKVNSQVVCITKPSPVAAPFVSSLPVSLFLSSLQADHENIFSFSQSWATCTAFRENKHNIHLKAGENPLAFFQSRFQVMLSMSTLFAYCYIQNVTATFDMIFC